MGNWMHFYNAMHTANGPVKTEIKPNQDEIEPLESEEEILNTEEKLILDETMIAEKSELDDLSQPVYVENYFQHQGIEVSDEIPELVDEE